MSVLAAAAVLAVGSAAPAIAATTGDLNNDGVIDSFDLVLCRKNLITMFSGGQADMLGDIDGNGSIQINDLVLLQKYVLGSIKEFPQASAATTTVNATTTTSSAPVVTTITTVNSGDSYMKQMAADIHLHEDSSVTEKKGGVDYGKIEKKTYYSKDAEREKNLNILLPPGYDGNMTHEGCMSPSEFCFGSAPSPYVLMITCTRFDGTVGDAPESYHKALEQNGVEHIWHELTDGDHGSISVRAHMYNFLRYAFKA